MRKFKAWDGEHNQMVECEGMPNLTISIDEGGELSAGSYNEQDDWFELELLEYIGRADIKGYDICDRDILINESGRVCKVVRFNSEYFVGWDLKALNGKGSPPADDKVWEGWEIIGNEFENPGLEKEIK